MLKVFLQRLEIFVINGHEIVSLSLNAVQIGVPCGNIGVVAQKNPICWIQRVNQQRQSKDVLRAVIRREVELRLCFQSVFHAEQRFIVRTLDVRLDVACADAAEQRIPIRFSVLYITY